MFPYHSIKAPRLGSGQSWSLERERPQVHKTADRQRSGKVGLLDASSCTHLVPNNQSDRSKRTKVFSNHSRNVSNRDPYVQTLEVRGTRPEGGDG